VADIYPAQVVDSYPVRVADTSSRAYTYSRALDIGTPDWQDSGTEDSDCLGDGDSAGSDEGYQKARATLFDLMYNTHPANK
jgi:hypothetical protein